MFFQNKNNQSYPCRSFYCATDSGPKQKTISVVRIVSNLNVFYELGTEISIFLQFRCAGD